MLPAEYIHINCVPGATTARVTVAVYRLASTAALWIAMWADASGRYTDTSAAVSLVCFLALLLLAAVQVALLRRREVTL